MNLAQRLQGKTIERIDQDEHEEVVVVRFTDGSFWVILTQMWNACGARLLQKVHVAGDRS